MALHERGRPNERDDRVNTAKVGPMKAERALTHLREEGE